MNLDVWNNLYRTHRVQRFNGRVLNEGSSLGFGQKETEWKRGMKQRETLLCLGRFKMNGETENKETLTVTDECINFD